MPQIETDTFESMTTPSGCLLTLGSLTIEQARKNWWNDINRRNSGNQPQVSWRTIRIGSDLLSQLEASGHIEITTALVHADRHLPENATAQAQQEHFDSSVEAVDLVLAALNYEVCEVNGFKVSISTTAPTLPVIEVPLTA